MVSDAIKILDELVCELGEGPSFEHQTDTLRWLDIVGRKLIEKNTATNERQIHELPVMASAVARIDDDRLLLATETGLMVRDRLSGSLDLLQPIEADNAMTRSNDARVHPSGALWMGTMGKQAERHAGAIYWYRRGELRTLYPELTIPNSICFSAAGDVAYFTDTEKGILFRVDCEPETGLPRGEPAVFVDHRGKPGGIDGSVIDANGQVWNARWGAAALDIYAPDGKRMETIALPARQPTCPAFFGDNAERLAITSAWQNMSDADRATDKQAGKTFELDRPVKGRFEPDILI